MKTDWGLILNFLLKGIALGLATGFIGFILGMVFYPAIGGLIITLVGYGTVVIFLVYGFYAAFRMGAIQASVYFLKNPPPEKAIIEPYKIRFLGKVLYQYPAEPFEFQVQALDPTKNQEEGQAASYSVDPTENEKRKKTKPANQDFEWAYENAKQKGLTKRQAYHEWLEKYPERGGVLIDQWNSFRHGMETQEKHHGRIFLDSSPD